MKSFTTVRIKKIVELLKVRRIAKFGGKRLHIKSLIVFSKDHVVLRASYFQIFLACAASRIYGHKREA